MIAAINKRLQEHFSQTKQCTWTPPLLDVTMDFTACCEKAEAILTGTYNESPGIGCSNQVDC
jgi:hypothetical protein